MILRSVRRCAGGPALWLTALALAAGVSGCGGTIEAYRSLSGNNKNDPDPATAPFTENLKEAGGGSYANLSSVPSVPVVATTAKERAKIVEGLNAQRTSTEAKDVNGLPGSPTPGPVPPPPPIPPSLAATEMAALPPPQPAPPPPPLRGANEPPVPGPLTSTLQPPEIKTLPGAEAARPAPPQGSMPPMPPAAPAQLPPAAIQSGNPQPAPAPAALPEAKPSPVAAALPSPKLPPMATTVAALDPPPGAEELSAAEQARLAQIVAQYNAKPGIVRVVAYAAPAVGGAEQLNSFRAALDRAQMVARALSGAGIPLNKIQTQAAPSGAGAPVGRIDVQLLS